jgi:hypothetical protein
MSKDKKDNGWGGIYNISYGLPKKEKKVEKPTSTINKILKAVGITK